MNPSDYDDILLDNEKNFFQTDSDEATVYHQFEEQQNERSGIRMNAHAYPQDQIPSSLSEGRMYQNPNGTTPEWWTRNKVLAGLSGIFFLERVQEGNDESGINKIDVDNLLQTEKNLGLNRMFAESDSEDLRLHGNAIRSIGDQNIMPSNDFNKQEIQPNAFKMSFFKEYLNRLFDENWGTALSNHGSFYEFDKAFDVHKNVENLIFLEEKFKQSAIKNIFDSTKLNMILKMKQLVQNHNMNAENFIKYIYSELCETMFQIFTLVQNCDSEYCMSIVKANESVPIRQEQPTQSRTTQPEFVAPMPRTRLEEDKKIDVEYFSQNQSDCEDTSKQNQSLLGDVESIASESKKGQRKFWSSNEVDELERLQGQFYPKCVPSERLDEFAKKYGRSLKSVQSKISKEKKKKDIGSDEDSMGPISNNSIKKHELSRDKMIQAALLNLPSNMGTKDEIIDTINQLYYQDQRNGNEEAMKNSISQILSSGRNIQKIKGDYRLKSQRYLVTDDSNLTSMKNRLQYILSRLPNYRGDIETIRKNYWVKFQDEHKYDKEKVWESNIVKILRQSEEFDSSNSKTKYKLIKDSP